MGAQGRDVRWIYRVGCRLFCASVNVLDVIVGGAMLEGAPQSDQAT